MSTAPNDAGSEGKSKCFDSTSHNKKPFPFLALPKELRLMVYERIPMRKSVSIIPDRDGDKKTGSVSIISPCTSVAILATCRQVQVEAAHILHKTLVTMLRTPLRILARPKAVSSIDIPDGILWAIYRYTELLEKAKLDAALSKSQNKVSLQRKSNATQADLDRLRSRLSSMRGHLLFLEKQHVALERADAAATSYMVEIGIYKDNTNPDADQDFGILCTFIALSTVYLDHQTPLHHSYRLVRDDFPDINEPCHQHWAAASEQCSAERENNLLGNFIDKAEFLRGWCV
jgi:hypothetical protein